MTKDGRREADAAFALMVAAIGGNTAHKVANAFALMPPSSLRSAFNTSDSATVRQHLAFT